MTIEEFMQRFGLSHKTTVLNWIEKGYIPGTLKADNGTYWIPEEALPPYTQARAKRRESVFISMLRGICGRRQVLPALYGMSDVEFRQYIRELEKRELISILIIEGIEYYYPTIKGADYVSDNTGVRRLTKMLQPVTESVVSGTVKGVIEYNETH